MIVAGLTARDGKLEGAVRTADGECLSRHHDLADGVGLFRPKHGEALASFGIRCGGSVEHLAEKLLKPLGLEQALRDPGFPLPDAITRLTGLTHDDDRA